MGRAETGCVQVRDKIHRRGALYDLGASCGKQLPRVGREVLRRREIDHPVVKSVYDDEQNDRKHREHLTYRPPLDQIMQVRDLHTTVAKDCRDKKKVSEQRLMAEFYGLKADVIKAKWRLGYSNNVDSDARGGVNGTFEPQTALRERIFDSKAALVVPSSRTVAYPLQDPVVQAASTLNSNTLTNNCVATSCRRYAQRQQTRLTEVAERYTRVQSRLNRLKCSHLRYQLPVEDATQDSRAYRLGLDDVRSTESTKVKDKKIIRPTSAGATSAGFRVKCTINNGVHGKVAGARRRPQSASVTYLKHATVCCTAPLPSNSTHATTLGTAYSTDSQRRQYIALQKLAKRGLLYSTPLAQVFVSLRQEGLFNLKRQGDRDRFERMTMSEYMVACGCLQSDTTLEPDAATDGYSAQVDTVQEVHFEPLFAVQLPPSVIATRKLLVVSRQQFHVALEPLNLSPIDVNVLFSALDLDGTDSVHVWDVMCTVERLQHEHLRINRTRDQILTSKDSEDSLGKG